MEEFVPFPKIPRLRRPVVVTEKLDGSNGAIRVRILADDEQADLESEVPVMVNFGNAGWDRVAVSAQSRKRVITPGKSTDNYGFARWVWDHAAILAVQLGDGLHFGEWWGQGIARGYNLDHKRFSLFNTARWGHLEEPVTLGNNVLTVVPVIEELDVFDTETIEDIVDDLRTDGSHAAPGFNGPEGVVVYHKAGNTLFKRLLENDEIPKGVDEK